MAPPYPVSPSNAARPERVPGGRQPNLRYAAWGGSQRRSVWTQHCPRQQSWAPVASPTYSSRYASTEQSRTCRSDLTSVAEMTWDRPVPLVGDTTSAADRSAAPAGWAFDDATITALHNVLGARRDIRRYRPDPVPPDVLRQVLGAGHQAPSVGHSQPWRFIVIGAQATRDRAALLADRERIRQADLLTTERRAMLLDLQLDGIREAPVGVVVACDRRAPAAGVLGRASFADADMWSCACAIENMWLAARAVGLGLGWVTLFQPAELAELLQLPDGVVTLGWLCVGWPDERPPDPGLERRGWSQRVSHLAGPDQNALVAGRDAGDDLLTVPGSLGILDTTVNRVLALSAAPPT